MRDVKEDAVVAVFCAPRANTEELTHILRTILTVMDVAATILGQSQTRDRDYIENLIEFLQAALDLPYATTETLELMRATPEVIPKGVS